MTKKKTEPTFVDKLREETERYFQKLSEDIHWDELEARLIERAQQGKTDFLLVKEDFGSFGITDTKEGVGSALEAIGEHFKGAQVILGRGNIRISWDQRYYPDDGQHE